jgi:hypothetical protein
MRLAGQHILLPFLGKKNGQNQVAGKIISTCYIAVWLDSLDLIK